jgi:glycosyltransferase involved in cell wall biosynthesis
MKNVDVPLRSITVNGRFLSQPITGVQRYALELLTALDILFTAGKIEHIPVTALVPPNTTNFPTWSSIGIKKVGRFTGQLWEQFDLPRYARGTLLFTPCGGAPITHRNQVITIHDAAIFSTPEAYTFAYRTYYKALQRILASIAVHLITVSEFSRHELIKFLKVPPNKISFTWLSGEHILHCHRDNSVLAKYSLTPGRYVLAVGSQNPNKNLRGLMEAISYMPSPSLDFVIAGGANRSVFAGSTNISHRVKSLGFVSDAELRTLYENAACFVFPSFYEGFGLPPLEAMTLGCPVVVSYAASLPEIFRGAAIYCDPYSAQDIARQISSILKTEHPDREFGMRYASVFNWEKCARETWSILIARCPIIV